MTNPEEILPGVIFYGYLSAERKEKVCFWNHHTLVFQVSGQFKLETTGQTISMATGEMLLIGKNQLGTIMKTPLPGGNYETIIISLQEDLLRRIALEKGSKRYPTISARLTCSSLPMNSCRGIFNPLFLMPGALRRR